MIKKIELSNTPPYSGDVQIVEPRKVNFIFGLNGSGKTTLSRYIRFPDKSEYTDCRLGWTGIPLKRAVYNSDYVKENFSESSVPGIFTLGEENIEIKNEIEELSHNIQEYKDSIGILEETLEGSESSEGLRGQFSSLENYYTDRFWTTKKTLDKRNSTLLLALEGIRGSKEAFKEKLLQQKSSNDTELVEYSTLEELCNQLFSKEIEKLSFISAPSFTNLIQQEQSPILSKVIVGKTDVDIATLIRKLGNDSWVRQGVEYLGNSDGKCPFCQKALDAAFYKKIEEYFDQTYTSAVDTIYCLASTYADCSVSVLEEIDELIKEKPQFLNTDDLQKNYLQLQRVIDANTNKLKEKKLAPNIVVTLESIEEIAKQITEIITQANQATSEYNRRIEHIKEERPKVIDSVWRYILDVLSEDLAAYEQKKKQLITAIDKTENEIKEKREYITQKERELRSMEQKLTSIIPTANGINEMLENCGFTGFHLEVDADSKSYQFIRPDGTLAYSSLSEGEKNFVTFLYFMYSLKGNIDDSGHNEEKVVVVDDPVSSLDNDVLFLVSSLLRDLFRSIYDESSSIKQIFVLSHNVYFFKEVSFKTGLRQRETGFWMISKENNISKITCYEKSPVNSTYEMLWDEVKAASLAPSECNTLTLANTMRRIIEHYFKFLGGVDLSNFHLTFPDGERPVFKSLISWANAGSHSAFDDYSVTPNVYNAEKYLKVFRTLFEKTNHIAHYNMMMKNDAEASENG